MGLRRVIWAAIIAAAAVLYLFDNETVTLGVLIVCAAAPLVSGLLLRMHPGTVAMQLEQDEERILLQLTNPGRMPLAGVRFHVRAENRRTGRIEEKHLEMSLPGKKETAIPLPVSLQHAGRCEIVVQIREAVDPLRLFRRGMSSEEHLKVSVYPQEVPMHVTMLGSAAAMLDSDHYSEKKRGNDPGEVRSIYEYQPGDPVKNIHWKLSEKLDKLLVKELGMPVADPMLVLLGPCKGWPSGADILASEDAASDTVISVFASVLRAMQEAEMDCCAGWQSADSGALQIRKITGPEDLQAAAEEYLVTPAVWQHDSMSLWEDAGKERFSHLVIPCEERPMGLECVIGGCQITLLQYGYDGSVYDDGGVSVVGYDETSWKQTLAEIEV